ncbi:MAG TPA: RdgB/HAM1 family non-canonical purine NTP pyrophosphatase [Candidatus Nanoarchaeia archaeon]|nr:RdgB/HAM1 family non-canonical purine NTP pyrophosphatase [Candidatus Nanoarchaeia archaeon]
MKNKNLTINFATSNSGKVREFKRILEPEIKVNHIKISYPEIRSEDSEEIARHSAKELAEKFKKNIVVEDSGLFIKALHDFPGTYSATVHKKIGLEGIIKLMRDVKNRECEYKSAVAYCEPGKKAISFLGTEKGKIAGSIRGKFGFGHDPIFIPEGNSKTYGEMENVDDLKKFRRMAVLKLRGYLLNKRLVGFRILSFQ